MAITEDEFTQLFNYMHAMRGEINELKQTTLANDNRTQVLLDRIIGMLDTDETERLALNTQVDRHEDWITRTAPKVGVRYAARG